MQLYTYKRCIASGNGVNDVDTLVNLLAPGRCGRNLIIKLFKLTIYNGNLGTHFEIVLKWMPEKPTNEKSSLVYVMT